MKQFGPPSSKDDLRLIFYLMLLICFREMDQYIELNNGARMPRLGLGTWKAPAAKTKEAVITAVRAGYRLIDCANDYDNEHVIGEALQELFKEGVVKREDLFIQAKLWNSNHR